MALYKRGNVWWMDVYQGAERKRIRKSTGTDDKVKARMIEQSAIAVNRGITTRQRAIDIINNLIPQDEQSLKIGEAATFYATCLNDEGIELSRTTREHRINIVAQFAEWAKEHTRTKFVDDVDAHVVFSFLQELNKRTTHKNGKEVLISIRTKNAYVGDLITVWKMFVKRSKATKNPWTVARYQRHKDEESSGRAFTQEEVKRMEQVALNVGYDWFGMIQVGKYTGLRQSDCANLRWKGNPEECIVVDFENNRLFGTPSKTSRKKIRVNIPIHRELLKFLQGLKQDGKFVFPARCGELRNRKYENGDCPFNDIIKSAGLTENGKHEKLSFHCFRHTFVSRLAEAGVTEDVRMRLAGHTSAETHDIYTHDDVSGRKAIDLLK